MGGVDFPLEGLKVRRGGNNAEQIFIEHPQHPDWSIYTSERQILNDESLRRITSLSVQIGAIRRSRAPAKIAVLVGSLAILILVLVAGVVAGKGRLVRFIAFQIPASAEINLGSSVFEQLKRQSKIVTDPRLEEKLHEVTSRLLPALANSGYEFKFYILDDTNVNAFALPGGNVIVLAGLLRAAERPEEIAGVLAHEIAHVTERHGLRKIIDMAGLYLVVQSLFGDSTGLAAVVANGSEFLLQQKYSRDFEREADDAGWQYLVASGIDPHGLIDFFKRLMDQEKTNPTVPALLSTHPATLERIHRLETKLKSLNDKP